MVFTGFEMCVAFFLEGESSCDGVGEWFVLVFVVVVVCVGVVLGFGVRCGGFVHVGVCVCFVGCRHSLEWVLEEEGGTLFKKCTCIEKNEQMWFCGLACVLETSREKSLGSVQNSYHFLYYTNDVIILTNKDHKG